MTDEDMIVMIAMVYHRQLMKRSGVKLPPMAMLSTTPSDEDKKRFFAVMNGIPVARDELMEDSAAVLEALDRAGMIKHG